eukprot:1248314-Prorocentrum_lima.AAC.1
MNERPKRSVQKHRPAAGRIKHLKFGMMRNRSRVTKVIQWINASPRNKQVSIALVPFHQELLPLRTGHRKNSFQWRMQSFGGLG